MYQFRVNECIMDTVHIIFKKIWFDVTLTAFLLFTCVTAI